MTGLQVQALTLDLIRRGTYQLQGTEILAAAEVIKELSAAKVISDGDTADEDGGVPAGDGGSD